MDDLLSKICDQLHIQVCEQIRQQLYNRMFARAYILMWTPLRHQMFLIDGKLK